MAIQVRRGSGAELQAQKEKLKQGEPVAILSDDPDAPSGKAFYVCYGNSDVRRMVSLEDLEIMQERGDFDGPQGPPGPQGPQGPQGIQGPIASVEMSVDGHILKIVGSEAKVSFDELTDDQKAELKGDTGPQGPAGTIDQTQINQIKLEVLQAQNPVGTILMSTSSANPSTYLGFGTWQQWGSGRVPIGINTSDSDFNAVEKTGGGKTASLNSNNLPSHNYTVPSHNHTVSTDGDHTHIADVTENMIQHTHTVDLTTSSAGAHTHGVKYTRTAESGSAIIRPDATGSSVAQATQSAGAHTHSLSGYTSNSTHAHAVKVSNDTAGSHNHDVTGGSTTTGSTGSGSSFSIMQPYITCYMWKRTA